jgi:hypothetical protein
MEHEAIVELCNRALEPLRPRLPPSLYQEIHDLINEYGEWGVGMEFLIDGIGELEIEITAEQLRKIETAVSAMGWAESDRMVWLRSYCRGR